MMHSTWYQSTKTLCIWKTYKTKVKKTDDKESDDEETDDKKGCHEESDDKGRDSNDDKPLVTVSESKKILTILISASVQ
jgi:hypothetical protein